MTEPTMKRTKLPGSSYFQQMSPEERTEFNRASQAARKVKREANKALNLRRDFLDAGVWGDLARERKVRLPGWDTPITTDGVRKYIRRIGWSYTAFRQWQGSKDMEYFAQKNSDWPLRALVGLMLEQVEHSNE